MSQSEEASCSIEGYLYQHSEVVPQEGSAMTIKTEETNLIH